MRARRSTALIAALACCAFAGGCNFTQTSAQPEKQKASRDEYVQVNSMGSWIPRKVKKKSDLIGDSTQVVESDALQRVQAAGAANVPKEGR